MEETAEDPRAMDEGDNASVHSNASLHDIIPEGETHEEDEAREEVPVTGVQNNYIELEGGHDEHEPPGYEHDPEEVDPTYAQLEVYVDVEGGENEDFHNDISPREPDNTTEIPGVMLEVDPVEPGESVTGGTQMEAVDGWQAMRVSSEEASNPHPELYHSQPQPDPQSHPHTQAHMQPGVHSEQTARRSPEASAPISERASISSVEVKSHPVSHPNIVEPINYSDGGIVSNSGFNAQHIAAAPMAYSETEALRLWRAPIDKNEEIVKPFLGGYRHRVTRVEYHHASAQTKPIPKQPSAETLRRLKVPRCTREVQTVHCKNRTQTTTSEKATQMAKQNLYVESTTDRVVAVGAYFDSAQWNTLREKTSITIQRYVRGWLARRRTYVIKSQTDIERANKTNTEKKQTAEDEKHKNSELDRRMNPRRAEDFAVLREELNAWNQQETEKINAMTLTETERKRALDNLLIKVTRVIQTIDRLKTSAHITNKESRAQRQLELMASPKKWVMRDGSVCEVHTPFTVRAQELMDLYNGLCLPLLTQHERLDLLLHVKWTVKEFECALTHEVVELIDREADMLNRGRKEKSLQGLRKRLANLFLQFVNTPEFNPEATHFQRVPAEYMVRTEHIPSRVQSSRSHGSGTSRLQSARSVSSGTTGFSGSRPGTARQRDVVAGLA